jgi:hypothetical protein
MNNIELKLKDYLSKHPKIIEDSLKYSFLTYNTIVVTDVEIEDEKFSAKCIIIKDTLPAVSPFLPIPKKFLRNIKILKINENIT